MINILCSCNKKLLRVLKTMLYSLYLSQKESLSIFYIKGSDIDSYDIYQLEIFCKNLNMGFFVIELPYSEKNYLKVIENKASLEKFNLSIETYYRIFALNKLAVSRILWLDCDLIVKKDLSEFYHQDLKEKFIAACDQKDFEHISYANEYLDPKVPFKNQDSMSFTSTIYNEDVLANGDIKRFNAGIILFDLIKVKKMSSLTPLRILNLSLLLLNKDDEFDQSVLNYLFKGKVFWGDPLKYNYPINNSSLFLKRSPQKYEVDAKDTYIIHYAGKNKPWDQNNKSSLSQYWEDVDKQCSSFLNSLTY